MAFKTKGIIKDIGVKDVVGLPMGSLITILLTPMSS